MSRAASVVLWAALGSMLACGPTPGTPPDSETTGEPEASTGVVPTSTDTTGERPACDAVPLPQGLPVNMQSASWESVADDQIQVSFVVAPDSGTEGPDFAWCSAGNPVGYVVILAGDNMLPGVHPVTNEIPVGVAIISLIAVSVDGVCEVEIFHQFDDGEVEVFAGDGPCLAIDIRGVTPFETDETVLNPNGSASAPLCDG
jgi:hypothetical protein